MCMPVPRLAIHLERNREIREPPKPNKAQKISSPCKFRSTPLAASMPSKPSRLKIMLTSTSTAILVPKNNKIRMDQETPSGLKWASSLASAGSGSSVDSGSSSKQGRGNLTGLYHRVAALIKLRCDSLPA